MKRINLDISSASKDNFAIEIPLSFRTPLRSVTMDDCNHDLAENAAAMAKDHLSLLDSSTLNDSCDHKGKEIEDEASVAEDCEDEDHVVEVRNPTTAQTNQDRKRVVTISNKKKPVRKRRVTANIAATKYEIGE